MDFKMTNPSGSHHKHKKNLRKMSDNEKRTNFTRQDRKRKNRKWKKKLIIG